MYLYYFGSTFERTAEGKVRSARVVCSAEFISHKEVLPPSSDEGPFLMDAACLLDHPIDLIRGERLADNKRMPLYIRPRFGRIFAQSQASSAS